MTPEWLDRFPALRELDPQALETLAGAATMATLPAGAVAFQPGSAADNYLMLADGTVRVQQVSESGREIVLYRVSGGETCVLTTACLLAHENYAAEGIAETEVRALVVPRSCFDRLMSESSAFRDFVFASYASRLTDLMLLVEEVAFGQIDVRLAQRLLDLGGEGGAIALTHQELATELGTAREVISRQLKEFERRGLVRLERGRVELLDTEGLRRLAGRTAA